MYPTQAELEWATLGPCGATDSAVTVHQGLLHSSLVDLEDEALQILRLRDIENHRMIGSRAAPFHKSNAPLRITGSRRHHAMKFIPGNVV